VNNDVQKWMNQDEEQQLTAGVVVGRVSRFGNDHLHDNAVGGKVCGLSHIGVMRLLRPHMLMMNSRGRQPLQTASQVQA
jgi:hypothetical protein